MTEPKDTTIMLKSIEKIVDKIRLEADRKLADGLKAPWPGLCLDADAKIKAGEFAYSNLIAHQAAATLLGKHQGLIEAIEIIREAIEDETGHD